MSNNAPDYDDNLVFIPEMTWEELVEKAKKMGYELERQELYNLENSNAVEFRFDKWGNVWVGGQIIVDNRTPSQMYQIMLALED